MLLVSPLHRAYNTRHQIQYTPQRGFLDGKLLWQYLHLSGKEMADFAKQIGTSPAQVRNRRPLLPMSHYPLSAQAGLWFMLVYMCILLINLLIAIVINHVYKISLTVKMTQTPNFGVVIRQNCNQILFLCSFVDQILLPSSFLALVISQLSCHHDSVDLMRSCT